MEEVLDKDLNVNIGKDGAKQKLIVISVCLALAFICITIASQCSFLYKFNDEVDANWYLTVGHGIVEGIVPYRDVFEQKGILLYFLFALDYLIFGNSFIDIYIVEVICAAVYLYICYLILRLYLENTISILLTVVISLIAYTTHMYSGAAVEEFCLPLLVFGLYVFLSYVKRGGDKIPLWQVALCGLFASCIFWMKYTAMAFYIFFAVIVFVDRCIKKDVKSGFIYAAIFVAGFIVPTIPCLIYLGVNGAIGDMIEIYLYRNIVTYRRDPAQTLSNIRKIITSFALHIHMYAIAVIGVIYIFKETNLNKRFKVYSAVLLGAFILLLAVIGSNSKYHLTILMFMPMGIYPTYFYLRKLFTYIKNKRLAKKQAGAEISADTAICADTETDGEIEVGGVEESARKFRIGRNWYSYALGAVSFIVLCFIFGRCTLAMFVHNDKSDYPQLCVAEDIEARTEGGSYTLLSYMMADYGFYNACDVPPEFYYFAQCYFTETSLPEMYEAIRSYVSQGLADYVIAEKDDYLQDQELFEQGGYVLIETYSYKLIEMNYYWHDKEFLLFEKQ